MKILITTPSLAPHGGIYNILEIANRLQDFGHEVTLLNQSPNSSQDRVKLTCKVVNATLLNWYDILVVSSPHAVDLFESKYPKKKIVFMQMLEHLFRPDDKEWYDKCQRFYNAPYPMISTATWGAMQIGRDDAYILGTGVNLDHFPISSKQKDGKTILLESPEPTNPAKDVDRLALKAAKALKKEGFKIIGYGAIQIKGELSNVPDEFYIKPNLAKMNELYERATILLKATKYDFRSTAPLEAMTKGTVTVRAIEQGDEDLHDQNAYCCDYDLLHLQNILSYALTDDAIGKINLLAKTASCNVFAEKNTWDYWMPKYNKWICQ